MTTVCGNCRSCHVVISHVLDEKWIGMECCECGCTWVEPRFLKQHKPCGTSCLFAKLAAFRRLFTWRKGSDDQR